MDMHPELKQSIPFTPVLRPMDFAAYLRKYPMFKEQWLEGLRFVGGDLAIGANSVTEAPLEQVKNCTSIAEDAKSLPTGSKATNGFTPRSARTHFCRPAESESLMPAKTNKSLLVVALFLCGCGCEQVNEGVSESEPAGDVRGADPTAHHVPSALQPPSTTRRKATRPRLKRTSRRPRNSGMSRNDSGEGDER